MKTLLILPAIVLGAASLVMSTSALAMSRDTTSPDPLTGLVRSTGHFLVGVGHGTAHVVGGVVHGTGKLVTGVAHGTEHEWHKITH